MAATSDGRGPSDAPVRRLTVLYDAGCPLCRRVRGWLERQWQLVPLHFVAAGSPQALSRFPALDHEGTLREITVIGDGGQVYRGTAAWVVCLWALHDYRLLSHRLSTPNGARLARGAMLAAARLREASKAAAVTTPPEAPRPQGPSGAAASGRPTAQGTAGRPGTPSAPPWGWTADGSTWRPPSAVGPIDPCAGHCRAESG